MTTEETLLEVIKLQNEFIKLQQSYIELLNKPTVTIPIIPQTIPGFPNYPYINPWYQVTCNSGTGNENGGSNGQT